MNEFQNDLFRLVQNTKEAIDPFSSKEEDAGADVQLVVEFAKKWDYKSKYEECKTELDRLAKKHEAEKLEVAKKTCFSFIREIIPVLDDAYQALQFTEEGSPLHAGVGAMIAHVEQIFVKRKGGVICPRLGETFDPAIHMAISATAATADDGPVFSGIIVSDVLRKGYYALGQVVRSAEVKVLSGAE